MAVEGNKGGEAGSDARRDVGEARRDGGEVRREEGNSYCITLAVQLITSAAISEEQKLELIQLVACESNLAKTLCATPPSVLLQQCLRLLRQSGKSEEVLLNDVRVEMVNKLGSKYYRNFGKIGTGKLRSILGKMAAIWVQQVDSQGNKIGEELLLEDATFHSHSYWKPVRESVDYLYDQVAKLRAATSTISGYIEGQSHSRSAECNAKVKALMRENNFSDIRQPDFRHVKDPATGLAVKELDSLTISNEASFLCEDKAQINEAAVEQVMEAKRVVEELASQEPCCPALEPLKGKPMYIGVAGSCIAPSQKARVMKVLDKEGIFHILPNGKNLSLGSEACPSVPFQTPQRALT